MYPSIIYNLYLSHLYLPIYLPVFLHLFLLRRVYFTGIFVLLKDEILFPLIPISPQFSVSC